MIGASLDEPIFRQHVAAYRPVSGHVGVSYLVTPSDLSPIDTASLQEEGVEHIRCTAEEFVSELLRLYPNGISPEEVLRAISLPSDGSVSLRDLENLRSFTAISSADLAKFVSENEHNAAKFRQLFYEGFGPNWFVIARGEIAVLGCFEEMERSVLEQMDHAPILVISGEAGAGKSTFTNWLAFRLATKHDKVVYLYQPRQAPFLDAMHSLSSYLKHERAIVLVDDLSMHAREIREFASDAKFRNVAVLTSVRSGEWASRVKMHLGDRLTPIELPRFGMSDVPVLISRIDQFYPAPEFSRLPYQQKVERFGRSRKQLLIALKEATYGQGFDEIIEHEVGTVTDPMTRTGLCLACICTLPRTGISNVAASSVLKTINSSYKLSEILSSLDGIVEIDHANRMKARHEIYAREVVERHIPV
jgi:hypothetical protein